MKQYKQHQEPLRKSVEQKQRMACKQNSETLYFQKEHWSVEKKINKINMHQYYSNRAIKILN